MQGFCRRYLTLIHQVDGEAHCEREGPAKATAAWRRGFSWQRLVAYTIRETIEILRDPIRLGFALFGTVFLMNAPKRSPEPHGDDLD
jgi:hypothetical protein